MTTCALELRTCSAPSPVPVPLPPTGAPRPALGASPFERARQLLTELRPDPSGPFGWRFDAAPPRDEAVASPPPVRVQSSTTCQATLPSAFRAAPRLSQGVRAAERVEAITRRDVAAGNTLLWLQRSGTLAKGLPAMLRALAMWAGVPCRGLTPEQKREEIIARGSDLLARAETAWWGAGDCTPRARLWCQNA